MRSFLPLHFVVIAAATVVLLEVFSLQSCVPHGTAAAVLRCSYTSQPSQWGRRSDDCLVLPLRLFLYLYALKFLHSFVLVLPAIPVHSVLCDFPLRLLQMQVIQIFMSHSSFFAAALSSLALVGYSFT